MCIRDSLGSITDEHVLVDEVATATIELEAVLERKIRYFAFPYGQKVNLNAKVFGMLRELGLLGVCSAYGGWNEVGDDPFHLQRLHGDPNFERIKNWLTYDPRIERVQRYVPKDEPFDKELLQEAIRAARERADQPVTIPFPVTAPTPQNPNALQ